MTFFIICFLTLLLVLNCLLLILLVLVQLPKKDAGAGMAFGAGTADALFGAGSGNALTKITKWAAGAFLVLALLVGWLQNSQQSNNSATDFTKMVESKQQQGGSIGAPQQPKPQTAPATGNNGATPTPAPAPTTTPAPAANNPVK